MINDFKLKRNKNWLTTWYISFFSIVVLSFTLVMYFHMKIQKWENFDYAVSQLGEEMLEEVLELREDLDIAEQDSIYWTNDKLSMFKVGIEKEIIDESIDNKLNDIGFVQIQNLLSNRFIYRSPEIMENNLHFVQPESPHWGYKPFEYLTSNGESLNGIGYSGLRIGKRYFAGLIILDGIDSLEYNLKRKYEKINFQIVDALTRRADSLYIENEADLSQKLKKLNAWAYIYIYDYKKIIWSSKNISDTEIYIQKDNILEIQIPREVITKEYFYDIEDNQNRAYRQYTLIYDINPGYIYKVDLAIPLQSIQAEQIQLFLYLSIGAILLISIVWGGGYILMRKALRPVDEIIQSVNEITSENLDKRLPITNLENEITRLVYTFNNLLDRLSKSFKMQNAFIADASHELRTPLSIMMSDIELTLKNLENKPTAKSALNNSISEIHRMARIVDDLNLLAKSDAGHTTIIKKSIRLDEVLMSTISRCQGLAAKKNVILTIGNVEVIEFYGDEELLIRALSNLVNNAIKYSHEKDTVEVSLDRDGHTANLIVCDNGIGIPKESHAKIFDRFYRVDSSRSRETGGSGLGLAIVKWICEIHSGTITVTSKSGFGSTFTIKLPIQT